MIFPTRKRPDDSCRNWKKSTVAAAKLSKNEPLLSETHRNLGAFSPLLATTMLQHPEYLWWLGRKRGDSGVRGKDDLLESLAVFR